MAKKERKRKNRPSFPQHKTISHLESLLLLQVRQKGRVAKSVEGFFYLGGVGINYATKKRLFFLRFQRGFFKISVYQQKNCWEIGVGFSFCLPLFSLSVPRLIGFLSPFFSAPVTLLDTLSPQQDRVRKSPNVPKTLQKLDIYLQKLTVNLQLGSSPNASKCTLNCTKKRRLFPSIFCALSLKSPRERHVPRPRSVQEVFFCSQKFFFSFSLALSQRSECRAHLERVRKPKHECCPRCPDLQDISN